MRLMARDESTVQERSTIRVAVSASVIPVQTVKKVNCKIDGNRAVQGH